MDLVYNAPYEVTRGTEQSAGLDLKLSSEVPILLHPDEMFFAHTEFKCVIPRGHFGMLAMRSSLAKRGIMLTNGVGIIDSDYRGEIRLPLKNVGLKPVELNPRDRIAQLIIVPCVMVQTIRYPGRTLAGYETKRGENGFGSTGV